MSVAFMPITQDAYVQIASRVYESWKYACAHGKPLIIISDSGLTSSAPLPGHLGILNDTNGKLQCRVLDAERLGVYDPSKHTALVFHSQANAAAAASHEP